VSAKTREKILGFLIALLIGMPWTLFAAILVGLVKW
jgi:hypothetical protein